MPVPMGINMRPEVEESANLPFPAQTKQATGLVNGVPTDVTVILFADKIMVTITQDGKLSQWIHVPLEPYNPIWSGEPLPSEDTENDLLPMPHLTAITILGGASPERETMGQLYATQIASTILTKNPEETRLLVVGLGFAKVEAERETYFDLVELLQSCL